MGGFIDLKMKRFFRCNVCGDIHYGNIPPDKCPTCNAMHAYAHITKEEALFVQEVKAFEELEKKDIPEDGKEELLKTWKDFTKDSTCRLTFDEDMLNSLLDGVLTNEKNTGLRLCPCRIRNGKREQDLNLLCPCNFYAQQTWKDKDECWCGLFKKRD